MDHISEVDPIGKPHPSDTPTARGIAVTQCVHHYDRWSGAGRPRILQQGREERSQRSVKHGAIVLVVDSWFLLCMPCSLEQCLHKCWQDSVMGERIWTCWGSTSEEI